MNSREQIERRLIPMWRELLAIDHVGRDDDFFRLGGHSLLGVRLASMAAETFDVPITILAVFRYPALSAFAAHIERIAAGKPDELDVDKDEFEEGRI